MQAANIGHFTFHALRHTFCTRALENDMDTKTVSTIMGHYSVAFTLDVYGHVPDSHKREEMIKKEGLFDLPTIPPQQQSYPVIVTPSANGFILNVIDFDDLSFEADNIQVGLVCAKDAITEKLVGYRQPVPTPCSDLVLSAGEFVVMITI